MTKLTKPQDVVWYEQRVIKTHDNPPPDSQWLYKIWLPDWLEQWDVYANWERERFESMAENLKAGDVLFDVGTEIGWQSLIYADFVSPRNMVLIESASEAWPTIKAIWQRNFENDHPPRATLCALVGDKTTAKFEPNINGWPDEANGDLIKTNSYQYIHDNPEKLPQITIDSLVKQTGIVPNALTIDVEGAEYLVLKGAENTLRKHKPKVWCSVHPDLLRANYLDAGDVMDLHRFIEHCGYERKLLSVDHEEHWYFTKEHA